MGSKTYLFLKTKEKEDEVWKGKVKKIIQLICVMDQY